MNRFLQRYLQFERWFDVRLQPWMQRIRSNKFGVFFWIVLLILLYFFRYQPLGASGGNVPVVYVLDRWTGTVTLYTPQGRRDIDSDRDD